MEARASSKSGSGFNRISPYGEKMETILFAILFLTLPFMMGFSFPESELGWKSATLNISAKRLDSIMNANDNTHSTVMELYGLPYKQSGKEGSLEYKELFEDEYHSNRYFGVPNYTRIIVPTVTKEKLSRDPRKTIRTDDFEYTLDNVTGLLKFTFFNVVKKNVPGSVFELPEVERVVFWQHRRYSGDRVFMVEFFIKDPKIVESLKNHYSNKYGEEFEDALGRGKLLSVVRLWAGEGTSIRLVEAATAMGGFKTDSTFSLVFSDIERTDGVLTYLHTLMKLAPDLAVNTGSKEAEKK